MGAQGQTYGFGGPRDTVLSITPDHPHGLVVVQEGQAGLGNGTNQPLAAKFFGMTGSTAVPDIAYNQASAVNLFPDSRVPSNMRCYLTRLRAHLVGSTAWANTSGPNPGIALTDTSANALGAAYIPQCALVPGALIDLPKGSRTPFLVGSGLTVTATYSASAKTLTLSSASLVTTLLANLYVTITQDATTPAAVGQSMMIKSQASTSVITLNAAFPVAPSTSAIYEIQYFTAKSGSGTTAVIPLSGNVSDHQCQGSTLIMVQGTGAGQYAEVSDNTISTDTTFTFQSRNTAAASGTLFALNSDPSNLGAVGFGMNGTMQLTPGYGIQASVVGVEAGGSNVRLYYEGVIMP